MKANDKYLTKEDILSHLQSVKDEFEQDGIVALALFGSYVSGTQTVYSDIDIAVKKQDNFLKHRSAYEYFEILNRLKRKLTERLHRKVDIFDLDSSSSFKKTIEGELIYV